MSIYLDHHATTPVDPRVAEAMAPFMCEVYGNAASGHATGQDAAYAVEAARRDVAVLLGCAPGEVVFTSGATESNNLALFGALKPGDHVVTTAIEHSAILACLPPLAARGVTSTVVPVGPSGIVDAAAVMGAVTQRTRLVSVMLANNEVGTVQPVRTIAAACRARGVLVHTDACQGLGRVPFEASWVDMASLSGHKLYGPKGIGALYVRSGLKLAPMLYGGHSDGGVRPGTLNVPGIVGLGIACSVAARDGAAENARLASYRDGLLAMLRASVGRLLIVNGDLGNRLPHNLHITLIGVCPVKLAKALDGVLDVSSASACHSAATPQPSHVLAAMGSPGIESGAPVRFGLGRFTTLDEVEESARIIAREASRLVGTGCA